MDCRLFGTKPLSEPVVAYCQLDPRKQTSMKVESKFIIFNQENGLENVASKMAAILSCPQYVNPGQ